MKRILLPTAAVLLLGLSLTSCYNTRLCVGNIQRKDAMVKVHKAWNGHFLFGLIAGKNATVDPEKHMGNQKDYMIKTNTTFVNGLVGVVTFGIYTPTTTHFYAPYTPQQAQ